MKIFVTAKPNAKVEDVEEIDTSHFVVRVQEPPRAGMANAAITRVLADRFGVARSRVHLASGFTSREKVFEIE